MVSTIKDVARETGLAISTISKFMNGGNVRAENRKKIEYAIEKLGYKPNEFARSLRGAKTFTVGIIVDNLKAIFSTQIVGLVQERLKEHGFSVLLGSHGNDVRTATEIVDYLVDKQVDAIVVEPLSKSEGYLMSAQAANVPVISIDRVLDSKGFDSITTNSMLGIYEAVSYLLHAGHHKIAIISGTKEGTIGIRSGEERLRGYVRALEDYEIEVREEFIFKGDFSLESGYQCMKELWMLTDRPTAVVISNYHMCLGVISAIHELGILIPEDISILSFDDMQFFEKYTPGITAVGQPINEYAKKIEQIVLKRISGDYSCFPMNLKLKAKLVERDSVKRIMKL